MSSTPRLVKSKQNQKSLRMKSVIQIFLVMMSLFSQVWIAPLPVSADAGWIAYNDLGALNGSSPSNYTVITSPNGGNTLPNTGELVDFATSTGTGVTLTVTGGDFNGDTHVTTYTGGPASGTEAYDIFNGKIDAMGTISYINQPSPAGDLVLTFTGMDPAETYNLVFYGHRDDYAWTRAAISTLSDVDAFTNASSAATDNPYESGGVLFTGASDASTYLPSDNDNGYVVRYTDIQPGSDGDMVLTLTQGGTDQNKGKYANALMLEEVESGPPPSLAAGDVIISGFQSWNDPGGQDPGEFVELFNTTDQPISLETMELISRTDNDSNGVVDVDWELVTDLSGKTIAPYSFFLIAESGVAAPGGTHDIETDMDLATGEGGYQERAIGLELIIDSVVMDNVLYGRHDGSTPAGEIPPGDIPFGGFPRIEVIRNTRGTSSFQEGLIRRETADDLYAGYDVAGYYADETSLGSGYPDGVWTSPHSETFGSYEARNAASPAVLPPGPPTCYLLTLGHTGNGSDPTASPTSSTGCSAGEYLAGEAITLSGAVPDSGWEIDGWYGTDSDASTADTNTLTMPASAHSAGAEYTEIVSIENWTAYVDLRAETGDSNAPNVLEIVPGTPNTQPIDPGVDWVLKDIATGTNLSAVMSVDMLVQYPTTNGGDSDSGTDADNIFGGIVDGEGGYEIVDPNDFVTLNFKNLNPGKDYVVAVTYNRDRIPPYTDRASQFTISGADTFVNASSAGVVVNSPDSVSFVTGDNFGNGYVAKWTGVTAADGSFSITAVQDVTHGWEGDKGYAMTSIMIQEGDPTPTAVSYTHLTLPTN